MIKYERSYKEFSPKEIKKAIYLDAREDGCWTCFVKPGQAIKKGEKLG